MLLYKWLINITVWDGCNVLVAIIDVVYGDPVMIATSPK